jgi:hypothetical protein
LALWREMRAQDFLGQIGVVSQWTQRRRLAEGKSEGVGKDSILTTSHVVFGPRIVDPLNSEGRQVCPELAASLANVI